MHTRCEFLVAGIGEGRRGWSPRRLRVFAPRGPFVSSMFIGYRRLLNPLSLAHRRTRASAAMAAGSARAVPTAVASRVNLGLVEHIAETSLARIFSIYEKHGDADYIGEPVSTTEHSVQAFLVAREACESAEAQVACLLHDIGHLCGFEAGFEPAMDGCGTVDHEGVGARFLGALGFPESVAYLVHQHVNAKRYRCAREPDYYLQLSDASKTTLRHQGGPFTEAEYAVHSDRTRAPAHALALTMMAAPIGSSCAGASPWRRSRCGQLCFACGRMMTSF